jgi:hypothetical protein
MARSRSTSGGGAWLLLVGVVVVGLIVSAAKQHPILFSVVVFTLIIGGLYWYQRQSQAQQRAAEEEAAALEAEKRWWREVPLSPGSCSVMLTSVRHADERLYGFLLNLSENVATDIGDAGVLLQRAEHIGPQRIVSNVEEDFAVELKVELEARGAKVKITESVVVAGNGRREPIPERVRNEVWRRDGGTCVDCGSRERLEYDHIVPVSKGGSNTARNIELRCEPCNRKKAANI